MDTVSKILEDLEKKSEELRIKSDEAQKRLNDSIKQRDVLNDVFLSLLDKIKKLDQEKKFAEKAPLEYKKEVNFIKIIFTIMPLICILAVANDLGCFVSVQNIIANLPQLLIITLACGGLGAVWTHVLIKDRKKKYKTREVADIEKDIESLGKELELINTKKGEIIKQIDVDKEQKNSILSEFYNTNNKINSIYELKEQVIEEYCKDNSEVENLLNIRYNEKIENEKQKVKK